MLSGPLPETAVKHRDVVVSHPTEQPPQSACEHPVVLVVRDDLHPVADAESYKCLNERCGIGERMTAVAAGDGCGQIPVQVRVDRARDVRSEILMFSPRRIGQLKAAINCNPLGIFEVGG